MKEYRLWTALVNIQPLDGYKFEQLVDLENADVAGNYSGAWAKVVVKADSLIDAYHIIIAGVSEKHFFVCDFEYLDDYNHYKESFEIDVDYESAEKLLRDSPYIFSIVGRLYPYEQ